MVAARSGHDSGNPVWVSALLVYPVLAVANTPDVRSGGVDPKQRVTCRRGKLARRYGRCYHRYQSRTLGSYPASASHRPSGLNATL